MFVLLISFGFPRLLLRAFFAHVLLGLLGGESLYPVFHRIFITLKLWRNNAQNWSW